MAKRLDELEEETEALVMNHETFSRNTRSRLKHVFDALSDHMPPPDPPKRPIGFMTRGQRHSKKASTQQGLDDAAQLDESARVKTRPRD